MDGKTYIIYHKNRPLSSNGDIFLNLLRQWRDEKNTKRIAGPRHDRAHSQIAMG